MVGAKCSTNIMTQENAYKFLFCWYITPPQTPKCQETGSFLHIWWECPVVGRIWTQIYILICSVLQILLHKGPLEGLLHNLPGDLLVTNCKLISFMFLATRLTITQVLSSPSVTWATKLTADFRNRGPRKDSSHFG